ncbi:MAG: hypothetical protein QM791_13950 [Ferruginibacter sp.]
MTREELEKAHQQSLTTFDDYLAKKGVSKDDEEKISQAKKEWEAAWNKLMETLLVLERLEI